MGLVGAVTSAHNHPQALHTLGQMLEYGDGIPQDLHRAQELYQRLFDNPLSTVDQQVFAKEKLERVTQKLDGQEHRQTKGAQRP